MARRREADNEADVDEGLRDALEGAPDEEHVGDADLDEMLEELEREGFARQNALDGERYFFRKNPKAWVRGILLGRYTRPPKPGKNEEAYFEIQITRPCPFVVDNKKNQHTAKIGAIVRIDASSALNQHLSDFAKRTKEGKKYETFVMSKEKVPLKGGQTYWRFEVHTKPFEGEPPF